MREKAAAKDAKEAEKARKAAEKSGEKPEEKEAAGSSSTPPPRPKPQTHQPWKKSATNTHAFQRMTTPRKVGGS